jgi:hypothetical protein
MQLDLKSNHPTRSTSKRNRLKLSAVALAAAVALTTSVMWANPAWAQDESTAVESRVGIREQVHQAGLDAAAELLGMTPDELSDLLWGGETLANLAEEHNVALSDLRAAVEEATTNARQERIRDFITQQVESGRISQERAAWILQGIENNWFGLRRFAGALGGLGRH